jgi:hypothetical protein
MISGESVELYNLRNIGDCERFWSSLGHGVLISEHLRRFDNKPRSVKINQENVCLRFFEHDCEWTSKGKTLDVYNESPWLNDLYPGGPGNAGFNPGLSSVTRIPCPQKPPKVTFYGQPDYQGNFMFSDCSLL